MDEIREAVLAALQGILPQKADFEEERKKREELEHRVRELTEENHKAKRIADEAQKSSAVKTELQKLGVVKVDLAYRAIRDDLERAEDGRLTSRTGEALQEYLVKFVGENPELLPARVSGGSGASAGPRGRVETHVDLEKIRPGMSPEEMERVRQEIARVASQTLRGF